jgi:O-antigen/teichoic acid export membrane protein
MSFGSAISKLVPEFFQRFRKYIENAAWLLFEKGLTLGIGMFVGVYTARYLHAESFGLLNYAISYVAIFSAFASLGLDQIMIRELVKARDRRDVLLGTAFVLKLTGSFLLVLIMLGTMAFMDDPFFTNLMIIIIACSELFKVFEVVNFFFQSQVQSKYVVQVQTFINLAISFSKIGLVLIEAPLIWFAIIILIGTMLNALGYIFAYHRREGKMRLWTFNKTVAGSLLRESWPLALYGIALNIQTRIDQVMLGKMLNNAEVGQYSAALKFIEVFGFAPMVIISTLLPAVTKAKTVSLELYHNRLLGLYRVMFLVFLVMSVPLYFFAEPIVILFFGQEYQAAGYLLSLFALRLFFYNMGVGKSAFIVNESLFRYSLITIILGAASNIVFNYFLIPIYGAVGAVASSMMSFVVSIFAVDFFYAKTRENQKLMFKGIATFWKLKDVL